jgi:hypothetical protein
MDKPRLMEHDFLSEVSAAQDASGVASSSFTLESASRGFASLQETLHVIQNIFDSSEALLMIAGEHPTIVGCSGVQAGEEGAWKAAVCKHMLTAAGGQVENIQDLLEDAR